MSSRNAARQGGKPGGNDPDDNGNHRPTGVPRTRQPQKAKELGSKPKSKSKDEPVDIRSKPGDKLRESGVADSTRVTAENSYLPSRGAGSRHLPSAQHGMDTGEPRSGSGSDFEPESESERSSEQAGHDRIPIQDTRRDSSAYARRESRQGSATNANASQTVPIDIARSRPIGQSNIDTPVFSRSYHAEGPRVGQDSVIGYSLPIRGHDVLQQPQTVSRQAVAGLEQSQQIRRSTNPPPIPQVVAASYNTNLAPGQAASRRPTFSNSRSISNTNTSVLPIPQQHRDTHAGIPQRGVAISGANIRPENTSFERQPFPNPRPTFTSGPIVPPRMQPSTDPPAGVGSDVDSSAFPFTVLTDTVLQNFVRILPHEFGERIMYLSRRVELLQAESREQTETALLAQAVEFSKTNKEIASANCCLSLALIRYCGSQHKNTILRFFKRLDTPGSAEKRELRVLFEEVQKAVKTEAQRALGPNIPQLNNDAASLGDLSRHKGYGHNINADAAADPLQFYDRGVRERLSAAYKKRNGSKWFIEGKVFAILWHEAAGESKTNKSKAATDHLMDPREGDKLKIPLDPKHSPALFKSTVFSHIRRMVVIRNKHGYCWCVPIGTYGGLGLRKKGLTREDIDAHTIVYDSEAEPTVLEQEPVSEKRPIAIDLVEGATLDPASRLHTGKPYSVEWNVKVMDVGQVAQDDIEVLTSYVRQEIFG